MNNTEKKLDAIRTIVEKALTNAPIGAYNDVASKYESILSDIYAILNTYNHDCPHSIIKVEVDLISVGKVEFLNNHGELQLISDYFTIDHNTDPRDNHDVRVICKICGEDITHEFNIEAIIRKISEIPIRTP